MSVHWQGGRNCSLGLEQFLNKIFQVSIRGRILTGVITKMKMNRTVVVRRDYLHYVKKYNRFEKRHKNMSVHLSPCFRDVQPGDVVTVGECR